MPRLAGTGLHKALVEEKFIHLVDVERATQSLDGVGGRVKTYADHILNQVCRVEPLPVQQQVIGRLRMYFAVGVDIQEEDRVTNIRRGDTGEVLYSGNTYDVVFVGEPAGAGHHQIGDLRELSGSA